jgi:hypothetical protein
MQALGSVWIELRRACRGAGGSGVMSLYESCCLLIRKLLPTTVRLETAIAQCCPLRWRTRADCNTVSLHESP